MRPDDADSASLGVLKLAFKLRLCALLVSKGLCVLEVGADHVKQNMALL